MMTVEQQNLAHRAVSALEGIQKAIDGFVAEQLKNVKAHFPQEGQV